MSEEPQVEVEVEVDDGLDPEDRANLACQARLEELRKDAKPPKKDKGQ